MAKRTIEKFSIQLSRHSLSCFYTCVFELAKMLATTLMNKITPDKNSLNQKRIENARVNDALSSPALSTKLVNDILP
jgi:hypothetical protein